MNHSANPAPAPTDAERARRTSTRHARPRAPGRRRARYYDLTAAGRKQLAAEEAEFDRMVGAIKRVFGGGQVLN